MGKDRRDETSEGGGTENAEKGGEEKGKGGEKKSRPYGHF